MRTSDPPGGHRSGMTGLESRLDAWARRRLAVARSRGVQTFVIGFAAFVVKQGWAALFGFLLLCTLVAARMLYSDDLPIARNDAATIAAVSRPIRRSG